MNEFLHMGGYGFYVWSSFGITAAIILWNIIAPILHHQKALREANDLHSSNDANF